MTERTRELEPGARTQSTGTTSSASSPGASAKRDIERLAHWISEYLEAIDAKNSNAERRRKRIFLESTLAWEFGEEVLRDPSFQELLDRLEASLSNHPEMEKQFRAVFGQGEASS